MLYNYLLLDYNTYKYIYVLYRYRFKLYNIYFNVFKKIKKVIPIKNTTYILCYL